jgi:hypothetical protein
MRWAVVDHNLGPIRAVDEAHVDPDCAMFMSSLSVLPQLIVQRALDAAQQGRTTLVIAHRLSTIKNAHSIAVISAGKVWRLYQASSLVFVSARGRP